MADWKPLESKEAILAEARENLTWEKRIKGGIGAHFVGQRGRDVEGHLPGGHKPLHPLVEVVGHEVEGLLGQPHGKPRIGTRLREEGI